MGKGGDKIIATATSSAVPSTSSKAKYTWAEVQQHRTPDNAWVVYQNKVYNVSNWFDHPGGAVIFTHAGDDMTDIFAAFHAPGSHAIMKKFLIGELVDNDEANPRKTPEQLAFEKGYRELRAQLIEMGMFKSNKWFYVYKCLSNLALWALAVGMVYWTRNDPTAVGWHLTASILLGLFFQQCGWLAHDFLHHQVFRYRRYGDYAGLFWGNLMQGFSVQWWKNKHNGHHAVPNLHSSTPASQDGDPDIDTMPLLAWSVQQVKSYGQYYNEKKTDGALVRFLIQHQAYFYFPILLLARLSWLNESFKVAYGIGAATENAKMEMQRKGLQYPKAEKLGIALHYLWVFTVSSGYGNWSFWYSLAFFLTTTCSCGFFLAVVFGLGHNGMATYPAQDRPDFWKLQVTTTRNVIGGHGFPQAFVDWFCGGLQYQVDHHLFPTLPRHSLKKAHALVHSFCQEWKVQYHEADLVDGSVEVLRHLAKVSDDFLIDFIRDGPTM